MNAPRSHGAFGFRPLIAAAAALPVLLALDPGRAEPTPQAAPSAPAAPAAAPCTEALADLYNRVSPAVVSITAASVASYDPEVRRERVAGSGVIFDASGLVVTNAHIVFGRRAISVTLDDGTTVPGQLVGVDPLWDLAVLRIPAPANSKLPTAPLGESARARVGDDVFAIGNPFGLEQTLTRGIISAVNRFLPNGAPTAPEPLMQTDAPINPGSSGGPLINRCGEVVGITTSLLADAQNIGFAIPVDLVRQVIPSLVANGRVIRPWLGIDGQPVTDRLKTLLRAPLVDGILVESVEPGSPAQKAGLVGGDLDLVIAGDSVVVGGDVLTQMDGVDLDSPEAFQQALEHLKVGASVHLVLFRDGETRAVDVPVVERPLLPQDIHSGRDAATFSGYRGQLPGDSYRQRHTNHGLPGR